MVDLLKKLFHPFKNMNEACTAIQIQKVSRDFGNVDCKNFIKEFMNLSCTVNEIENFFGKVEIYSDLFPSDFINQFDKITASIKEKFINPIDTFIPSYSICCVCNSNLSSAKLTKHQAHAYYYTNSNICSIISLQCKKCQTFHYPSYYEDRQNNKCFYDEILNGRTVHFTNETIFDIKLLKSVTYDLLFKHASFSSFADSYNALLDKNSENRFKLIDKRLSEAWFSFNVLILSNEINLDFKSLKISHIKNLDILIESLENDYFCHFVKKWSGDHHKSNCHNENCSKCIVIDGCHKINRLTCMFDQVSILCPENEDPGKILL